MNRNIFKFLSIIFFCLLLLLGISYIDLKNKLDNYNSNLVGTYSNNYPIESNKNFSFLFDNRYIISNSFKIFDEGIYSRKDDFIYELNSKSGKKYYVIKGIVKGSEGIYYFDDELKTYVSLPKLSNVPINVIPGDNK